MMYTGFVIEYTYSDKHPDKKVHYEGPYSTIEETKEKYHSIKLLEPAVKNVRICRLICEPHNPELY